MQATYVVLSLQGGTIKYKKKQTGAIYNAFYLSQNIQNIVISTCNQ